MVRSFPFHTDHRYRDELWELGLDGLEACLSFRGGDLVKSAIPGREVRRVAGPLSTFYLKTVVGKGWRDIIQEARILEHLTTEHLPVPAPVAMGAQYGAGAMVTLGLPSAVTLESLFGKDELPESRRTALADSAAMLLRELHARGTNHRDYYSGHLLVDQDDRLYLVDLGRAELRTRVPFRRIVKDIAAFHSSVPLRIRGEGATEHFIEVYLGAQGSPRLRARLERAVRAKEASMRRHAEKSVRRGVPNIHVNR